MGRGMSFLVDVTINYRDGQKKHFKCKPTSLYSLKKVVATFATIERDATSVMFTVCETHKTGEEA
jgi:hypothetical protein